MSNRSDTRRRTAALLALAAALMLLPYLSNALAGVDLDERANALAMPAPARTAKAPTYQLRCWQYGRLLFEENDVDLPADPAAAGFKLRGHDRYKRPVYVSDTSNATCLLRALPSERTRVPGRP